MSAFHLIRILTAEGFLFFLIEVVLRHGAAVIGGNQSRDILTSCPDEQDVP